MTFRFPLAAAGLLGVTGVALGALGAHALKTTLMARGMSVPWETAARYHIVHAVALVGLAAWMRAHVEATRLGAWAAWSWLIGTLLFSGSLYWLALGGPRWLGPVTPFGGIALMLGWVLLVVMALKRER